LRSQDVRGIVNRRGESQIDALIPDLDDRGALVAAPVGEILKSDVPGHIEVG